MDSQCGVAYEESSPERVNRRNGYRERRWNTRVGTIDLAIPVWLLEARRRVERAVLQQVVAECYMRGGAPDVWIGVWG